MTMSFTLKKMTKTMYIHSYMSYILSENITWCDGGHISGVIVHRQGTLFITKIFCHYCPGWKNIEIEAMQCIKGKKMEKRCMELVSFKNETLSNKHTGKRGFRDTEQVLKDHRLGCLNVCGCNNLDKREWIERLMNKNVELGGGVWGCEFKNCVGESEDRWVEQAVNICSGDVKTEFWESLTDCIEEFGEDEDLPS